MTLCRLMRAVYRALAIAGGIWVYVPPVEEQTWQGPPAWHPERLLPDVPLNETEMALFRQLTGIWQ
jgi:hypothetical protein